jgi:hypothetical protein
MEWARSAWMAVNLLAFAAGSATAGEPKRVLLLHSFGWNFQAEDAFASYLCTDLAEKSPYSLDRYEVSLEIARFGDGERDEAFADYLRALFATRPPDLIITMVVPPRGSFSAIDETCFLRRRLFLPALMRER